MLNFIAENPVIIVIAVIVVLLVIFLLTGYEKAPSDQVFIISGLRKKPRILIGKAGIRILFLCGNNLMVKAV